VRKDIVIAVVAVVIVAAVAFGLAAVRPNLPGQASHPFSADSSGDASKPGATDKVVMRVNGQPVTEREFALFMQSVPADQRPFYTSPAGRRALADELVKLRVLEQEGGRLGVANDPEVKTQVEMARAQITAGRTLEKLANSKVDQQIHAEYEKEKAAAISLRHILVAYAGGQVPARGGQQAPPVEVAMKKAQGIAAKLRAGADFGEAARAESDDEQSGAQGGSLGPAKLDMLPPDIAAVVSKLKPGQMSDAVKTSFGVQIFKVEQPSFEDLRPMLTQKIRQQAALDEVKRLQTAAKVDLDPQFFPPAPAAPQQTPQGQLPPGQPAPKSNG
jgi:peptidyl-prolyl cis-trans isomerase C